MHKRQGKIVIILFIVLACLLFGGYVCMQSNGNAVLYIEYGDSIQDYEAYTLNEERVSLDKEGITVYFYLSDTCGSCIDMMDLYKQLENIDFGENISFYCLWEDSVPVNKIEKLKINKDNVLTLHGKYRFQSIKPYFYFVEAGEVIFSTQDYQEMIDKFFAYIEDKEKLKQTAFEKICGNKNTEKYALLFTTEGLGAVKDNHSEKLEQFEFEEIYTIADYWDEEFFFDKYGLYRKIFKVDLFPSLVWQEDTCFQNIAIEDLH